MITFPYNAILKLEHFADQEFANLLRKIMSHWLPGYSSYPSGKETAKPWEMAQCIRALRDFGALHSRAELLGVGAGSELTIFYLTNYARRVFATDLYATNIDWKEADRGMLVTPETFAPQDYEWKPQRLVVQHMDALDLCYEDGSFDGVFSCGSIEHFGSLENVERAVQEMARVLKPGGVLTLATEFRIAGPADGIGIPGAILFTPEMIQKHIVEASGLVSIDPMDGATTPETIESAYPLLEAIEKGVRERSIALSHDGYFWTSGSVCLRKI